MQLKGLVRLFTAALILISLYQLSFTPVVRSVEKKIHARAKRSVLAEHPDAKGDELKKLIEARFEKMSDSMQGETVYNLLFLKYTYQEAKEQELNLGLDLQGGMNVTLEVSLDDLVRSMSNNPKDVRLNKAIEEADRRKANSQADFVTLFGEAFSRLYPGEKIAYLFTKPSVKEITLNSTNEQVLAKIREEAGGAIQRTYNVLQTRIDKFGVSQPNLNLDATRGIITVELAGVRNPERVREYLQSTAKLQFFETYTNEEIIQFLQPANDALVAYLAGETVSDSTATAAAGETAGAEGEQTAADTASLSSLLAKGSTTAGGDSAGAPEDELKKIPLLSVWNPYITQQGQVVPGPIVGMVAKKDTAKMSAYLALDVVRSKFPPNVKFVYGAESREERRNPNGMLALYAIKLAPGGGAPLEGDRVTDARMDYNQLNGEPEVSLEMDMTGAQIWRKMTARNKGRYIAVTLDDKVYSCPVVNDEIAGGRTSISGRFTTEDATQLADILKAGKLPAPARIVQEQVVGPTLGAENIAAGMNSLIISFIVIFVLMLVYFNTGGMVANIALILNVLFTFGILAAMHATLTMASIAGLVLTIGMAVDTNVLIFERIKEELTLGKSYQQAVADGYKRSYAPVLDGHITSLITAVILFIYGLGPVLGFATTQIIGLLLSLFCGIMVSRLITDAYMKRGRHFNYFTKISRTVFQKAHFKFIEKRKIFYAISTIVILLGIGSFIHGFDYGVEFSGGRSYTIRFDEKHTVSEVREKLQPYLDNEYPVVKTIGTENHLNITTSYLIEKTDRGTDSVVLQKLYEGLKAEKLIPASVTAADFSSSYLQKTDKVLPTISDDLKAGATRATIVSIIAIFLYILVRFRKWQYSLGTIISLIHDVCLVLAVFSFMKDVVPFSLEIDQHFIAAILTVIGFSMNDTVIVFDRMREYFRKSPHESKTSVINRAINDTLSRTVMTSLCVFLSVLILFIFGGEATRGFAFAMMIGVIVATYSSIFVAAPILVDMDKKDTLKQEEDRDARIENLKKMA
jgi:SecD/SecF fusion protein